jgi:hypothetical protein
MNETPMSTSELFRKHFGDTGAVGLKHPRIDDFFKDLKRQCMLEDIAAGKNIEYWNQEKIREGY